jgi:hypothetical protein
MAFGLRSREAVSRDQVGITRVPNRARGWRTDIQVHSHTLLLRTLAGKGVDSS